MKINLLLLLLYFSAFSTVVFSQTSRNKVNVTYIDELKNHNHPQIGYWFFSPDMLSNDRYLSFIDTIKKNSRFDFIFLTARENMNFYEFKKLKPVFQKLVDYAHSKKLRIGLQLFEDKNTTSNELTDRFISDGEIKLDNEGNGKFIGGVKYVRDLSSVIKSELFKVYVFKKTAEGFYDKTTLHDITAQCSSHSPQKDSVIVDINQGSRYKGYTAFIMLQHYTKALSHYSSEASNRLIAAMNAYSKIRFDGIALDEYSNIHIIPPGNLAKTNDVFRERLYSLPMAKKFKTKTGFCLEQVLFDMRFAPDGQPEVRATAINQYMSVMHNSSLHIENDMYRKAKEIFGIKTFIGVHNTFHNSLINDELWETGCKWWSVKRDYGQTDEETPIPTQMGIALSNPMNVLYNMYYSKDIEKFTAKALTDLRYGIRTHYHAFNDTHGYGVSLEKSEAYENINPVEDCARLLNYYNPSLPKIKLLVVFGMEALSNWYPNESDRGAYDINDKLGIEEKAVAVWKAGYTNALVPTDLILEHKLTIDTDGKPSLNGHKFDAMIFLDPQYAQEPVLKFLEDYIKKGGKLMIEGNATLDFNGKDIRSRFKSIVDKSTVKQFSIEQLSKLGITKNTFPSGCISEDGTYIFTDVASLRSGSFANTSITIDSDNYSILYKGLAALKTDKDGVKKFTAKGFKQLTKNGKVILKLDTPKDIYLEKENGNTKITIIDQSKTAKLNISAL